MSKSIFRGAIILSIAGIITKILGAIYRIPFARLVGDEGMGLYQMAYPLYTMILAISTAGVPIAISKLVAERVARYDRYGVQQVFWVSLGILLLFGVIGSLGLYLAAPWLANNILMEPRAVYSLRTIAPALLLTSVMSTFRGYFQGFQQMVPTAISQVLEQFVRVITVFWAAIYLLPRGVEFAAAGATFGAASGGMAALIILVIIFVFKPILVSSGCTKKKQSNRMVIRQILSLAIPVSLGGLIMPLMQTIDSTLVPMRLQSSGLEAAQATKLFGQLSGMAGSLINLPIIITGALATILVPAVSELAETKAYNKVCQHATIAFRLTTLLMVPAATGLIILAKPICILLYDLAEAGDPLAWLALSLVFIGVYQVSTGILQGLNKPVLPVISLGLGAIMKLIVTYSTVSIPFWGIKGAAFGTVIAFAVAALINCLNISRLVGSWFSLLDHVIRPIVASVIMTLVVNKTMAVLNYIPIQVTTIIAIVLGGLSYFIAMYFIGGIKLSDFNRFKNIK